MTLNASVAGRDVIHVRRIDNVAACGVCDMVATRTVTPFAADVPLSYLLGVNVIPDRMTAVAKRSRWAVHVVRWVESGPPVASRGRNLIFTPFLVLNLPLHGQREIVVPDFCEVALLPNAAVNKSDLILREF